MIRNHVHPDARKALRNADLFHDVDVIEGRGKLDGAVIEMEKLSSYDRGTLENVGFKVGTVGRGLKTDGVRVFLHI